MRFIVELIAEAQRLRAPVILILSGWNGLTTNYYVFDQLVSMFKDAGVRFKTRCYAENPREWFDVSPQQARTTYSSLRV